MFRSAYDHTLRLGYKDSLRPRKYTTRKDTRTTYPGTPIEPNLTCAWDVQEGDGAKDEDRKSDGGSCAARARPERGAVGAVRAREPEGKCMRLRGEYGRGDASYGRRSL